MALTKNVDLKNNFGMDSTIQNAYLVVEKLSGGKQDLGIYLAVYDQQKQNRYAILQFSFAPKLEGKNFIAQAYEHLKTLPEFVGAEDC